MDDRCAPALLGDNILQTEYDEDQLCQGWLYCQRQQVESAQICSPERVDSAMSYTLQRCAQFA